jgi:hypothetical protein
MHKGCEDLHDTNADCCIIRDPPSASSSCLHAGVWMRLTKASLESSRHSFSEMPRVSSSSRRLNFICISQPFFLSSRSIVGLLDYPTSQCFNEAPGRCCPPSPPSRKDHPQPSHLSPRSDVGDGTASTLTMLHSDCKRLIPRDCPSKRRQLQRSSFLRKN